MADTTEKEFWPALALASAVAKVAFIFNLKNSMASVKLQYTKNWEELKSWLRLTPALAYPSVANSLTQIEGASTVEMYFLILYH